MQVNKVEAKNILTRSEGFLATVSSHSLNPYAGCPFGKHLCGRYCYVQHNFYVTKGREWGTFLDVRTNAHEVYRNHYHRERRWAQKYRGEFTIFMASSTEPFSPQERRFGITRRILETMIDWPPDTLILQTHSHTVTDYIDLYEALRRHCRLRFHISIETDRDHIDGLPPHASPIDRRFEAARMLKDAGFPVVVAVSMLMPIAEPVAFFKRVAESADAVLIDHFIGGDGTPNGSRTKRTELPVIMAGIESRSVALVYRDEMAAIAQRIMPGRVGISIDGFAGRFLT